MWGSLPAEGRPVCGVVSLLKVGRCSLPAGVGRSLPAEGRPVCGVVSLLKVGRCVG